MSKVKINWRAVPEALETIGKYSKQHLPTILVLTGVGLSLYSKYLTSHESVKAEKAIDHEARQRLEKHEDPLDRWGRAKIYFEYCWLSMLMETGSIVLILAAHKINLGKIAAMTSLYQVSKNELKGLKDKIIAEDGKGTLKKLQRELRGEDYDPEALTSNDIRETGKGNTLFIDKYTGSCFHSSISYVNEAIADLNTCLQNDNYVELSDFLAMLGESHRDQKCGRYAAFRFQKKSDVVDHRRILDWHDYVDPTTGEPRVCFIDYTDYLTPSDDFVERGPW